ncbi:MAG TPA: hypothetical protein VE593_08100 [Nitrososphaeraceae archaeon]|nr:hypothetical protein [Nitrososphaeraceae archaeon]
MSKKRPSLCLIAIIIILTATTVLTLTDFGKFAIAQGQSNTTSSLSLTPEQKAALCDPNNPSSRLNPVNTTESRICGIPVTVKPHSSNTTSAGTETPSGSLAPSVVPSPEG